MFENIAYLTALSTPNSVYSENVFDVTPIAGAKQQSCSYCGKHRLSAFHIATQDGRIATSCYPCSDNGMNWLEQNFPKSTV